MNAKLSRELLEILDVAMEIDGAAHGTVQVFNRKLGGLEIFAHRGFDKSFLDLFQLVRDDEPSICGRALRLGKRVTVSDVATDRYFAPYVSTTLQAGVRSVQSTPILGSNGEVVGMLSTHYSEVHSLSHAAKVALDEQALRARVVIEDHHARQPRQ
jgi:GAF domain-containing protein